MRVDGGTEEPVDLYSRPSSANNSGEAPQTLGTQLEDLVFLRIFGR